MANKRLYEDVRKMAKAANQRMRELERAGMTSSPAYQAAQAKLEMMGVSTKKATGRRFSETGRGEWSYILRMRKVLSAFLGSETSTPAKSRALRDRTWETANKNNQLSKFGITKDDWFDLWKNLPQKEKDRRYGSSEVVRILKTVTYNRRNGKKRKDQKIDTEEIANALKSSRSVKEAERKLGITYKDKRAVASLGSLDDTE